MPDNNPRDSGLTEGDSTHGVSPGQDMSDGKTTEVCGVKTSTTGDAPELFAESKRRSDGVVANVGPDTEQSVTCATVKDNPG